MNTYDFDTKYNKKTLTFGAMIRNSNKGLSKFVYSSEPQTPLFESVILSTFIHPVVAAALWFLAKYIMLMLVILGISLPTFKAPQQKVRDLQFTLVDKTPKQERVVFQKPKIVHTKQIKPVSSVGPEKFFSRFNLNGLKSNKKAPSNSNIANKNPEKLTNKAHNETVIPLSHTPHKGSRLVKKSIPDAFSMPMPKFKPLDSEIGFGTKGSAGYSSKGLSNRSILGSGEGAAGSGESFRPGHGKRRGGGYSYENGGSDKPGVGKASSYNYSLRSVDLNPYITELKRRVKRNWSEPSGVDSKKVVLFLRISRSGRLLVLNVKRTSGNPDVDDAAIKAVKQTVPFTPLPANFKESYLDVIFSFDYNIMVNKI